MYCVMTFLVAGFSFYFYFLGNDNSWKRWYEHIAYNIVIVEVSTWCRLDNLLIVWWRQRMSCSTSMSWYFVSLPFHCFNYKFLIGIIFDSFILSQISPHVLVVSKVENFPSLFWQLLWLLVRIQFFHPPFNNVALRF